MSVCAIVTLAHTLALVESVVAFAHSSSNVMMDDIAHLDRGICAAAGSWHREGRG